MQNLRQAPLDRNASAKSIIWHFEANEKWDGLMKLNFSFVVLGILLENRANEMFLACQRTSPEQGVEFPFWSLHYVLGQKSLNLVRLREGLKISIKYLFITCVDICKLVNQFVILFQCVMNNSIVTLLQSVL